MPACPCFSGPRRHPRRHTFCDVTGGARPHRRRALRLCPPHHGLAQDHRKFPRSTSWTFPPPTISTAKSPWRPRRPASTYSAEKPIATSTADALKMVEAVKASGVKNQLAFNYRRLPAVVLAKKFIDEGAIGEIRNLSRLLSLRRRYHQPMGWRQKREVRRLRHVGRYRHAFPGPGPLPVRRNRRSKRHAAHLRAQAPPQARG